MCSFVWWSRKQCYVYCALYGWLKLLDLQLGISWNPTIYFSWCHVTLIIFSHTFCLKRRSLFCSFHFTKIYVSISILFIICCSLFLSLFLSLCLSLSFSLSVSLSLSLSLKVPQWMQIYGRSSLFWIENCLIVRIFYNE